MNDTFKTSGEGHVGLPDSSWSTRVAGKVDTAIRKWSDTILSGWSACTRNKANRDKFINTWWGFTANEYR
jgi:hypothetical protein